jgi:hypothetical protein
MLTRIEVGVAGVVVGEVAGVEDGVEVVGVERVADGVGVVKMSLLPDGQVSTNFEVNRNGFKCHKSVIKIIFCQIRVLCKNKYVLRN